MCFCPLSPMKLLFYPKGCGPLFLRTLENLSFTIANISIIHPQMSIVLYASWQCIGFTDESKGPKENEISRTFQSTQD